MMIKTTKMEESEDGKFEHNGKLYLPKPTAKLVLCDRGGLFWQIHAKDSRGREHDTFSNEDYRFMFITPDLEEAIDDINLNAFSRYHHMRNSKGFTKTISRSYIERYFNRNADTENNRVALLRLNLPTREGLKFIAENAPKNVDSFTIWDIGYQLDTPLVSYWVTKDFPRVKFEGK